jgi:hypothetical protein
MAIVTAALRMIRMGLDASAAATEQGQELGTAKPPEAQALERSVGSRKPVLQWRHIGSGMHLTCTNPAW